MWPKSYVQLLYRVAERLDAVDRARLATSLGMVEYAQRGQGRPCWSATGSSGASTPRCIMRTPMRVTGSV
jgi:hypothetical protein